MMKRANAFLLGLAIAMTISAVYGYAAGYVHYARHSGYFTGVRGGGTVFIAPDTPGNRFFTALYAPLFTSTDKKTHLDAS